MRPSKLARVYAGEKKREKKARERWGGSYRVETEMVSILYCEKIFRLGPFWIRRRNAVFHATSGEDQCWFGCKFAPTARRREDEKPRRKTIPSGDVEVRLYRVCGQPRRRLGPSTFSVRRHGPLIIARKRNLFSLPIGDAGGDSCARVRIHRASRK